MPNKKVYVINVNWTPKNGEIVDKVLDQVQAQEKSLEAAVAQQDKPKRMSRRERIIYTLIHNYNHMLFGLTLSSMAPAFIDYKAILHTEMSWIGLFPMFQAIGIFIGSFMTASYKILNRQITLSVLVTLQGLGTIFQPWSTHLWHLYLCIFIYGFGIGAWNGANNVILIEMWQAKSPSMLQFSQFIYGVGTILGPLLDRSFVLGEQVCPGKFPEDIPFCYNQTIPNTESLNCTECLEYDRRPRIKIPLMIGGLLQLVGPALYMLMFVVRRYHYDKENSKVEVTFNEEQKARVKKYIPRKTILVCISLYFAFGIFTEMMFMDFAPTFYQYCAAKLSAEEASELYSYGNVALTVGRAISIFISMYVMPWIMISYNSLFVFIGYIFTYFGQNDQTLLTIGTLIICFGYSSIFICLFSFVGMYVEMTDKIGGLFIGSYNIIYMFLPYFIGTYIETYPPSFLFINFFSFCIAIIAFIVVLIAVWKVPKDLLRKIGPIGH